VQFLDGATVLGTVTISGGTAALAVSTLAPGSHSITAVYSGDSNNATSTSAVLTQTIHKAATTVTVAPSANPSAFGQSVTFSVQLSPSAATGTVQVLDGSTAIGTITLSGGAGALSTSALAAGSHSVTVVYSGDASYSGSTSAAVVQTVNKAPSTIAAASSSNPSTFGQGVTFTAAVSPSSAGGTVQFLDGGAVIGTATVTSGVAALATSALGAGTHSITAVYSGDASYSGSTSAALGQAVNKAAAVIVVASSANPANYGQPVTFRAAITPPTAIGTVQFLDGGTLLATANVMSGAATLTISSLAAGSHPISAIYPGDANYLGASAGLSQTVKPTTATSLTSNTTSTTYGQTVNFTATVSPSAATGTVLLMDGAVTLGSAVLSNGQAKMSIATLSAGNHSVTAVYSGDAADSPSASSARIVSVSQAKPTINLSVSPNPATAGQAVTCTAKVSPNSATGTVAFYDGATLLGTGMLSGGTATYAISALTSGNHAITAVYNGDTNFVSVTSNKSNLKVN
jgi:large repetitive protein